MRSGTFRKAMGRDPRKVAPFHLPVQKAPHEKLPPGAMFHYWHPDRDTVEHAPREFDRQLKQVHPGLAATRPPANVPKPCDRRWIIWQRDPSMTFHLCRGWKLLFLWPPMDYDPIPLDNRVFANLAIIDPRRYASSVAYFDTIVDNLKRESDARDAGHKNYLRDRRRDLQDTWKISTAGRGNRFAMHHDGTILPSRGEQNWARERERLTMPDALRRARAEQGLGRRKF